MGHGRGCRKGCSCCRFRYFGCCDYCNMLGLGPDSELLFLIVIGKFWFNYRGIRDKFFF